MAQAESVVEAVRIPTMDDAVREVLERPLSQELIEVGGMLAAQFAVRRSGLSIAEPMVSAAVEAELPSVG